MTQVGLNAVARHLRSLTAARELAEATDGELLERFAAERDEAAFATLLHRHGQLVLSVGRRIVQHTQDSEDVFQSAFLLLAQNAGSIRKRNSVGCWLHGVTRRLALRVKTQAADIAVHADSLEATSGRELCSILDEELARLPERLRAPLVMCCLEGQTHDEAARSLGWSLGTLKRRLEQAQALLRSRLEKRGVSLPATLAGALAAEGVSQAAVSAALMGTVVTAAATGTTASALVLAMAQPFLDSPNFWLLRSEHGYKIFLEYALGARIFETVIRRTPNNPWTELGL